jgi:hypothetical protein
MGDGLLAEFSSVVNAIHVAIDIQRAMAERNAARLADAQVVFRIGINLGDIIVEEGLRRRLLCGRISVRAPGQSAPNLTSAQCKGSSHEAEWRAALAMFTHSRLPARRGS